MLFDNDPRLARLQPYVDALDAWYDREMDALDDQLINGGLSQDEYNKQVKLLGRTFQEDYADIYAG